MVMLEGDVERGEQPRLEIDLVVRRDNGYGQRTQREQPERDESGYEHGARELFLRLFQFGGMDRMNFDAGEKQQDSRQESDVVHARDVREKAGMGVSCAGVNDLRNLFRNVLEGDFVIAQYPDQGQRDDDHAVQYGSDDKALARDSGDGRCALERHPCGEPVHNDREESDENAVLRKVGYPDHVRDGCGGKSQYGGVPHHVLNPLEEDGRKAQMRVESLFHPGVDASASGGECAAQFGSDQCGGNEEQKGREENVEEHRKLFLGHHRQPAQADHGRCRHQRELHGRNVFTFSHCRGVLGNLLLISNSFRAVKSSAGYRSVVF